MKSRLDVWKYRSAGFRKSVSGADEKPQKPLQEAEVAPPSAEHK